MPREESEAADLPRVSPSNDGTMLDARRPEGAPIEIAPERLEEFSPVSTPTCSP